MNFNHGQPLETAFYPKTILPKDKIDDKKLKSDEDKRIVIVDILRGFALFGVLLIHLFFSFSGWNFLTEEEASLLVFSQFDEFISEVVKFFFSHKFRAIFSFLFGLSFSIQLESSIAKGLPYKKIFYRRMSILFLFGCIHGYFFWHGDILRWYVVAGLILILIHNWKSKNILLTGLFLSIVVPILNGVINKYTGDVYENIVSPASFFEVLKGNSISDLLYFNFFWDLDKNLNPFYRINFVLVILGQFMIGYWAGRNNVFKNYKNYLAEYKVLFLLGIILGVGGTGLVLFLKIVSKFDFISLPTYVKYGLEVPENLGIMALSLAYVCGLTLLHEKAFWKNKLAVFIPIGRMALTNYIMQTLLCIGIFYGIGLGLIGKLSLIFMIPLCFIIFSFQIFFSTWWLNNFQSGPLEWIWRSLMMGKKQPFMK